MTFLQDIVKCLHPRFSKVGSYVLSLMLGFIAALERGKKMIFFLIVLVLDFFKNLNL